MTAWNIAVDQHGQVVDVWLSARRDPPSARQFFNPRYRERLHPG